MDGAAIFLGVDDGGGRGRKPRKIGRPTHLLHCGVILKEGTQRHRACEFPHADEAGGRLEDAGVQRFKEMLGLEELRDAVTGLVVGEHSPQQRHLRLNVMGRGTVGLNRRHGLGRAKGGDSVHGCGVCSRRTDSVTT